MKLKAKKVDTECTWFTEGKVYDFLREYFRGSVLILDDDNRQIVQYPNDPLPGDYAEWEVV